MNRLIEEPCRLQMHLHLLDVNLPAALLVGIKTPNEMDELLGDELFGHDELQLAEVGPLLLCEHRHFLQVTK